MCGKKHFTPTGHGSREPRRVRLIRAFDAQQKPIPANEIFILRPARHGRLEVARRLTADDGVEGGPYFASVSPDGDSALILNALDRGSAKLLTGIRSGDPAQLQLKPLPSAFFGPPFPLGPSGPPTLAAHGQARFTPDGETALVVNFIPPPLAGLPLTPSVTVLTRFQSGNIRVVEHLTGPSLNASDQTQEIATVPSGLQDYVNLFVPPGEGRSNLTALLNEAIAESDRGEFGPAADSLVRFMYAANSLKRDGILAASGAALMTSLATAGMVVAVAPVSTVSLAAWNPGGGIARPRHGWLPNPCYRDRQRGAPRTAKSRLIALVRIPILRTQ